MARLVLAYLAGLVTPALVWFIFALRDDWRRRHWVLSHECLSVDTRSPDGRPWTVLHQHTYPHLIPRRLVTRVLHPLSVRRCLRGPEYAPLKKPPAEAEGGKRLAKPVGRG